MVGEVIPLEEGILLECDSSPPEEGLPLEVRVFPWQKRGFPWKKRGFSWKVRVLEERVFSWKESGSPGR